MKRERVDLKVPGKAILYSLARKIKDNSTGFVLSVGIKFIFETHWRNFNKNK